MPFGSNRIEEISTTLQSFVIGGVQKFSYGNGKIDQDGVAHLLDQVSAFCREVLTPTLVDARTCSPSESPHLHSQPLGVENALRMFGEGGWQALRIPKRYGGEELPMVVVGAVCEFLSTVDVSIACRFLETQVVFEALMLYGHVEQKEDYLRSAASGVLCGCTTARDQTSVKAEQLTESVYRLKGYCSLNGDKHLDLGNCIHLTLADIESSRNAGQCPALFLVPHFLHNYYDGTTSTNGLNFGKYSNVIKRLSGQKILEIGQIGETTGFLVGKPGEGDRIVEELTTSLKCYRGFSLIGCLERLRSDCLGSSRLHMESENCDQLEQALAVDSEYCEYVGTMVAALRSLATSLAHARDSSLAESNSELFLHYEQQANHLRHSLELCAKCLLQELAQVDSDYRQFCELAGVPVESTPTAIYEAMSLVSSPQEYGCHTVLRNVVLESFGSAEMINEFESVQAALSKVQVKEISFIARLFKEISRFCEYGFAVYKNDILESTEKTEVFDDIANLFANSCAAWALVRVGLAAVSSEVSISEECKCSTLKSCRKFLEFILTEASKVLRDNSLETHLEMMSRLSQYE